MRKIVFLTLLLFANCLLFAQDRSDDEIIKNDFEAIISYTNNHEIGKILDMSYPRMFEIMPKEAMETMVDSAMATIGIKLTYGNIAPNLQISRTATIGDAEIAVGKYNQSMTMTFKNEEMVDMILSVGKTAYPDYTLEKVDSKTIVLDGVSYLLAIKDSYTDKMWKYINYSGDQNLFEKMLPAELLSVAEELKAELNNIQETKID